MVSQGPPNPIGGAQSLNPSLLQSNSGLLNGAQASSIPSQSPFSSLASPRTQFNGNSLLGNVSNVSALLNRPRANGGPPGSAGGLSVPLMNLQQRGGLDPAGDLVNSTGIDALSFPSASAAPLNNQLGLEQPQTQQQVVAQDFQPQLSLPHNQHQLKGGNTGAVKLEPHMGPNDQNGPTQMLHSLSAVKLEPQQPQTLRGSGPVKAESQHSDGLMFHQQQLMQLSRPTSQAAAAQMSLLQQQQILQLQQQQQQQQQQRSQLQQQMLHQQNLPLRTQVPKPNLYEPGTCARRLTHYMYHQQHRPQDNNIQYWRNFVNEYYAPNAKKRLCVSLYGSGRQTTGVFPQDVWHCEICNRKPGRGFETTVEVLPRLCQIKYASGTLEELLYVDMPREYQNASGQIVLDYAKAVQESVFEQLRVVREGQLRIVFNPDLKIASWEFCAKHHEELIPRRSLIPQVSQLRAVVQKYQATVQGSSGPSAQDLQTSCNSFVATGRQLAKALDVPLVNDLGYTKRYVRCLQIAEVVNCMKDLIDYSRQTGTGPMESLNNFLRRSSSGVASLQPQQPVDQQTATPSLNHNGQKSVQVTGILPAASNIADVNSRPENPVIVSNGQFNAGNNAQIPTTSSLATVPPMQSNLPSFPSVPTSQHATDMSSPKPQEADPDSQSSVQRILQEMMMSSQLSGACSPGNDTRKINGVASGQNGGNCLVGSAITSNSGIGGTGFGGMGGGLRTATSNNAMGMNANPAMYYNTQDSTATSQQQLDVRSRLLGGLRAVNSFNNLQYDWKSSQ